MFCGGLGALLAERIWAWSGIVYIVICSLIQHNAGFYRNLLLGSLLVNIVRRRGLGFGFFG